MNDINTIQEGLKNNKLYFYLVTAFSLLNIIASLVNIPVAEYSKKATLDLTKRISENGNDANNFKNIIEETTKIGVEVNEKFGSILGIYNLIGLISFVCVIAAIVFLTKTVMNYYGAYSRTKQGKTLVTPSGAAWGFFIPILNLIRPFNVTNEVLNGETTPEMDSQVATAKYAIWTSVLLSIVNAIVSSITPTILTVGVSIVATLLFVYSTYLIYQVHNRIFAKQAGN